MSEKNYDNDPIERFFREKANNYDISYNEEDWLKLETRLDKAEQQRANRRLQQVAAAAVALLFAVLAFFTYQQQVKINELSDQLSNSENVVIPSDNFMELIPNNAIAENQESENNQTEVDAEEEIGDEQNIEEATAVTYESSQDNNSESDINYNIEGIATAEIEEDNLAGSLAKTSPGFDGRSPALAAIKPLSIESTSADKKEHLQGQTQNPASTADGLSAHQKASRFSVGVQLGPDMSTVNNLSDFAKPGRKIGLSLEYNVTDNLAISTGAQHTKVRYVGSGDEYKLPEGYLPYGASPGKMEGVCLLIDIPVSLKYDFLHFHNSRIFTSAGVSSYIMLNEDYKFTYEDNQSVLSERWQKQTGTRHWMSNGTLSVGYELDLRQNISIRAEPFLKVPLKEVGWGNVDLYSMGSFFSINYKW